MFGRVREETVTKLCCRSLTPHSVRVVFGRLGLFVANGERHEGVIWGRYVNSAVCTSGGSGEYLHDELAEPLVNLRRRLALSALLHLGS